GYNPPGCRSRQNRQENRHYKCAYIFILHFEPRLMRAFYGYPGITSTDYDDGVLGVRVILSVCEGRVADNALSTKAVGSSAVQLSVGFFSTCSMWSISRDAFRGSGFRPSFST